MEIQYNLSTSYCLLMHWQTNVEHPLNNVLAFDILALSLSLLDFAVPHFTYRHSTDCATSSTKTMCTHHTY